MRIQTTTLQTDKPISLTFTDKPITAWGGLTLFAGFAKKIRLPEILRQNIAFEMTSPNAIRPVDMALSFLAGILVGSRRFAHLEAIRHDYVLKEIFGIKRFPSATTFTRFFRRFSRRQIEATFPVLHKWQLGMMTEPGISYTLDLDSTVFERYGNQEGAVLGFNPKKHRRPSHHPIFAILAENYAIAHEWLRSGNTASLSGAIEFTTEALENLPAHVTVGQLRADSGFESGAFFDFIEGRNLIYAVAARFTSGVKRAVFSVSNWRNIDPDTSVGEAMFQAKKWTKERRLIIIRQRNRKEDFVRGRELFDDPAYLYQAIFTNKSDLAENIWRYYRGRANLENRVRELKWDYGIDGFCMKKFYATEAAFRMVCVTYNLMEQFVKTLGFTAKRTLGTLRTLIFACGAMLGRDGHRLALRLSMSGKRKERFLGYLAKIFPSQNNNCVAVESG